MKKNVLQSKK